jgi:hypothetical protein
MNDVCIAITSAGDEVNISVHPSAATVFGIGRPAGSTTISGLGDAAYCDTLSLVWVLKGDVELGVSARTCAQAVALAKIALPRI